MKQLLCIVLCTAFFFAGMAEVTQTTPTEWSVDEPHITEPAEPVLQSTARYELTAEERDLVERVVMAEAGGESYEGKIAVAQCILNACERDGKRPCEIVIDYQYSTDRPEPTDEVRAAVSDVFDKGETVTEAKILFFYAPARVSSEFHESQTYVMTVGGHRFFEER